MKVANEVTGIFLGAINGESKCVLFFSNNKKTIQKMIKFLIYRIRGQP